MTTITAPSTCEYCGLDPRMSYMLLAALKPGQPMARPCPRCAELLLGWIVDPPDGPLEQPEDSE